MNRELLALYWDIGRLILDRRRKEGWGAGVIPRPDLFPILPPVVAKLAKGELVPQAAALLPAATKPSTQDSILPTASTHLPVARIFGIAKQDGPSIDRSGFGPMFTKSAVFTET